MDLSVIIVNYNVKYFLEQSLLSVKKATEGYDTEVFVIDNASEDGSAQFIRENFQWVKLIENTENLGFGRANNQGLKLASGKYILILNPDSILGEDSLRLLIDFLDKHPDIGAVGPKIVDREGKFELACRRGFPTPFAAFSKITGLASLFPNSRFFAKYNLTYLDPDKLSEVDALVGAFILLRREVYEKVGGFDEQFFMYGEDLDLCYRIKAAGWKIYYNPESEVIHYKGESTLRSKVDVRKEFFRAMHLFVKKHYFGSQPLALVMIRFGIFLSRILDILKRYRSNFKGLLADLLILNLGLSLGWSIRYLRTVEHLDPIVFTPLTIYNIGWIVIFLVFGVYGKKKGSVSTAFFATIAGLAFLFTFTYFFKQYAFSRFITLFTGLVTLIAIPGWRWLLIKFPRRKGIREWFRRRTLLVGVDSLTEKIAERAVNNDRSPFKIVGFIERGHEKLGEKIAGIEVIGSEEDLHNLIEKLAIEEVIFSGQSLSYNEMVRHITAFNGKVGFKVVPETALESSNGELPFLELGYSKKPSLMQRIFEKK